MRFIALLSVLLAVPMYLAMASGDKIVVIQGSTPTVVGSNQIESVNRDIDDFDRISLNIVADVEIRQGDGFSVQLRWDDNLLEQVQTDVDGRTLEIYTDGSYETYNRCQIYIVTKRLEEISNQGRVDIDAFNLDVDELHLKLQGQGEVHLAGDAGELILDIQGRQDVDALSLNSQEADVTISGHGDVHVYAEEYLRVNINGKGNVYYEGSPRVRSTVSGHGIVMKEDEVIKERRRD